MALDLDDLSSIEIALLGVLSLGLPPSRAAGDDTFRVDHCTAVVAGIEESANPSEYLAGAGPRVGQVFAARLEDAIASLTDRGLLADQPAGMPAPPGGFEPGPAVDVVNPDSPPAVLDRGLGPRCLHALPGKPGAPGCLRTHSPRAGEFWRSARETGYGG